MRRVEIIRRAGKRFAVHPVVHRVTPQYGFASDRALIAGTPVNAVRLAVRKQRTTRDGVFIGAIQNAGINLAKAGKIDRAGHAHHPGVQIENVRVWIERKARRDSSVVVAVIHCPRNAQLPDVIQARDLLRLRFGRGKRRQQQCRENGNDGDDDEQFDQSKTLPSSHIAIRRWGAPKRFIFSPERVFPSLRKFFGEQQWATNAREKFRSPFCSWRQSCPYTGSPPSAVLG